MPDGTDLSIAIDTRDTFLQALLAASQITIGLKRLYHCQDDHISELLGRSLWFDHRSPQNPQVLSDIWTSVTSSKLT